MPIRPYATAPNVVMILGASHSGTTMLDLMLGNHEHTFSTGEVWAYYRPWRKHHFNPVCGCGDEQCEIWQHLLDIPQERFHAAAANLPGILNAVDSSKDLSWAMDSARWARDTGVNLHNVVIWKDPIELAYSHWKRGQSIADFRYAFLTYYERFLHSELPFVSVRYSTLVKHPAYTLRKLCEITDLPWTEGQEEFWHKEHHHLFGAARTGKQARTGKSSIMGVTDFPQEFLQLFSKFSLNIAKDRRLMRVIGALESMNIENIYVPKVAAQDADIAPIKPLWYYKHSVKRVVLKRFPRTYVPTAADLA